MDNRVPFCYHVIKYFPSFGCIVFAILITISSIYYPGGSEHNPQATQYSWNENYMCDITASVATNGLPNDFAPVAVAAMLFITGGIAFFFYLLPYWLSITGLWGIVIRWLGISSMIAAMLIFTSLHDMMIGTASLLALLPLLGTFYFLAKYSANRFFFIGLLILLLIGINNYIYYTDQLIDYLPSIQKSTFIVVILWLIWMNTHFVQFKSKT